MARKPQGKASNASSNDISSQSTLSSPTATSSLANGSSSKTLAKSNEISKIIEHVWGNYWDKTPQRVKLIDAFMGFLILVGALQFAYCVIGGNYVSSSICVLRLLCCSWGRTATLP
jgi:oligosaccharyltransferase complex subunit epsilon